MKSNIGKYSLIFICLMILVNPAIGQEDMLVKGKIMANKKTPLQNVSVSVEGSDAVPEITDENGEFEINVSSGQQWLIINPLGDYKGKRVFLNNRTELTVYLAESDMKSGYDEISLSNFTAQRRDLAGAFSDIDITEIDKYNITTVGQILQYNVPGVMSVNHSGMPGQGAVNFIRGINSMNTTNSPLVILDGIPLEQSNLFPSNIEGNAYNPLSTIDPSDIAEMVVFRDPSLTSIYGSRASNGVMIINTLQPEATETSIKVSVQSGLNLSIDQFIPQLNDGQYRALANEVLSSSFMTEDEFKTEYSGLYAGPDDDDYFRYRHNTDWQKSMYDNSLLTETYLSVKGGSDIATYGLSIGYHNQGGIYKNTNFDRFNVRLVSDLNVFQWFKMQVNANLTNNNASMRESALSPQTNPILTSLFKPPIMGPYQYDDNGNQISLLDEVDELGTSNPKALTENFMAENTSYRFLSSILNRFILSESVEIRSLVGLNFNNMKERVFMPNQGMEFYYQGETYNVSQRENNHLFSFYTNNYLNFSKQYNVIHDLNVSAGTRIHVNRLQVDFAEAQNLPQNDKFINLQSGQSELRSMGGLNNKWNWISLYSQINYKLKDRYILNAGLSTDYSTQTGDDADAEINMFDLPFGLFYSIGAGWRISEESFLKQVNGIENLTLRGSYGTTGNNDIGTYNSLNYYLLAKFRETSGLIPGGIPNETLKYETLKQFNAGFDLSLMGDRTRFAFDFFKKTTEDMLIYEPQPSYRGFEFRPTNGGTLENTGLEFSLYRRLIDQNNFKWDLTSAITFYTNEVTEVKGSELVTSFQGGEYVTRKGLPLNSFYGYEFEGVYASYEEAADSNMVNAKGFAYGAGDAIYKDISGPDSLPDGVINNFDKVNLGSPNPDYFGSLSNTFQYKRWSLNMMIQFVVGNEVFNYTRYMNERMIDVSNQSASTLNRWQKEGDETEIPRALWNDPIGNSDFSSRWIEDGSYIRLKNITLGYDIPGDFLVFKNASFFLTATNIITLDKYLGYDPEFSYSFNPMAQGIDYGLMPQFRKFLIGITVGL